MNKLDIRFYLNILSHRYLIEIKLVQTVKQDFLLNFLKIGILVEEFSLTSQLDLNVSTLDHTAIIDTVFVCFMLLE